MLPGGVSYATFQTFQIHKMIKCVNVCRCVFLPLERSWGKRGEEEKKKKKVKASVLEQEKHRDQCCGNTRNYVEMIPELKKNR